MAAPAAALTGAGLGSPMSSAQRLDASGARRWPGDRALSARVVGFCRHLRDAGIPLGLGEQADAARAAVVALRDPQQFRMALRATTAKSRAVAVYAT